MKYYYGKYIVLILFLIIGLVGAFWNKNIEARKEQIKRIEVESVGHYNGGEIIKFQDGNILCYLYQGYQASLTCVR